MVIADTAGKNFAPDAGGYTHYNHEEARDARCCKFLFPERCCAGWPG